MKRIGYTSLATIALMLGAALAFATPMPNSAIIDLRLCNDCGTSTIAPVINNYPALISITDTMHPACVGFANRHAWSFSEGFTPPLVGTMKILSHGTFQQGDMV